MIELLISIGIGVLSFIGVWVGAGIVVKVTEFVARQVHISSFIFSFLVLGTLTNIPELAIFWAALRDNNISVSVGNLMGGIVTIALFIVPCFSIIKDGLLLRDRLEEKMLAPVVIASIVPFALGYDKEINGLDAFIILVTYILVMYLAGEAWKKSRAEIQREIVLSYKIRLKEILNKSFLLILALFVVFISSHFLSRQIIFIADYFKVNSFFVSFLILGIGTNLPEISIMIRALRKKYTEVAIGNYFGSMITNLLLISVAIFLGGPVTLNDGALLLIIYVMISFGAFYMFFKLNNKLNTYEAYFLLLSYVLFIILQISNVSLLK